ncbi:phage head-tail connector protein [Ruminococcus sp.]|uniref:phage head-tail connector protein n=1 Tax=Ruminococcus sp. TaxID=41978 RepID=UPI0025DAF3A0|nr:phage head-tail connector protein [Ruminococcus sp.]
MMMIDKLLVLLGSPCECSEETAEVCLSMAEDAVLDYIGREDLPKSAESIVIKLAVIYYNRLGNEGETTRTEGGISQSFCTDIPDDIKRQLHNYPRKVGVIYAPVEE